MRRNEEIQEFMDKVTEQMFGRKMSDCGDEICVTCGEPKGEFKDKLSETEWGISKMCQKCQDFAFGPPPSNSITVCVVCEKVIDKDNNYCQDCEVGEEE